MSGTVNTQGVTLSFNEIPYNWNVPGTYLEVRPDYNDAGLFAFPARGLLVGQMLAGAPALPNVAITVFSALQAQGLFGQGSACADMALAFFAANPTGSVDIIGCPAAVGATRATATVTLTGTATAAGVLALYFAGNYVPTVVSVGDSPATVATNLVAAIGAAGSLLPVTAAAVAGVVTLTAKTLGALGLGIDVRTNFNLGDATPAGLGVALAQPAGGAGAPDITAAIAGISGVWYTDIAMAFSDANNISVMEAELARRFTAMGKLDGRAYVALDGTPGQIEAWTATMDSQLMVPIGGQNLVDPPWMLAASLCGVGMFNLANDPARQLRGKVLVGLHGPAPADRFNDQEQNVLLGAGCSTFDVLRDGSMVLSRVVTSYTTSSLGVPDQAWMDVMTQAVVTRIRWDWNTYMSLTYPNNKLADDGSLAAEYDGTIATPRRLWNAWASRSQLYERQGWIEDSAATAQLSVFQRDATSRNRVNARQEIRVIGNLMVLAGALQFQV